MRRSFLTGLGALAAALAFAAPARTPTRKR